jgi:hypothetical protein
MVTKVKPNINSVEVHPQLSNNGYAVDGVLVGAGSLWLYWCSLSMICDEHGFFGGEFLPPGNPKN